MKRGHPDPVPSGAQGGASGPDDHDVAPEMASTLPPDHFATRVEPTHSSSGLDDDIPTCGEIDEMAEGTVLLGKYRVVRTLGAGGLGRVYLVHHLNLDAERASRRS